MSVTKETIPLDKTDIEKRDVSSLSENNFCTAFGNEAARNEMDRKGKRILKGSG